MKHLLFVSIFLLSIFNSFSQEADSVQFGSYRYLIYPVDIVKAKVLVQKLEGATVENRKRESTIKPFLSKLGSNFSIVYAEDTAGYSREEYPYMIVARVLYAESTTPENAYCFYDRIENRMFHFPHPYSDKHYFREMVKFRDFVKDVMVRNHLSIDDVSRSGKFKKMITEAENKHITKMDRRQFIRDLSLGVIGFIVLTGMVIFLNNS